MVALVPAPAGTAQILLGGRINLSGLELSIHIWPNARGCLKLDGNLCLNGYKLWEVTESFQTYILGFFELMKKASVNVHDSNVLYRHEEIDPAWI